jgi:orotidine-5'-phosphate decarboxylase
MNAITKYEQRAKDVNSLLCVGLDSDYNRLPARFRSDERPQFTFNRWIIDQTHPYVSAFKPNMAFYEARGAQGLQELALTLDYLRQQHPNTLTICDAKRADIGSTSAAYARAIFDQLGFDAVTLHPYLGRDALSPFLERGDRGCIILCRTSNPGAGEFQDLIIDDQPLWEVVARQVYTEWNAAGNCMLVVGATYPEELRRVREIVGEMTLLVPGVGAQGGDIAAVMEAGLNQSRLGMIVNASRSVLFADDPAAAARQLRDDLNRYR